MAADDWAIVVGINRYPGLTNGDLQGPVNDATDFATWLKTSGPSVPPKQIQLIQSPTLKAPTHPDEAKPALQQIHEAFSRILDRSAENLSSKKGRGVGRRLYIYFAGHGFEPVREQAVLLLANAVEKRVLYHVPGRSYPDYCYRGGLFKELVLFMDCCRESYARVPLMEPPLVDVVDPNAPQDGRRLYGFGTQWSRNAWEKSMPDGKFHGVFTTALLDGLKGKAVELNGSGRVTAASLSSWLYNEMKTYLDQEERKDPDIYPEPSFYIDRPPGEDFVLVEGVKATGFPVKIDVRPETVGATLEILDGAGRVVQTTPAASPSWNVSLPRGFYKLRVKEKKDGSLFEVPVGGEPVHV